MPLLRASVRGEKVKTLGEGLATSCRRLKAA